jgi:hypothetical protein
MQIAIIKQNRSRRHSKLFFDKNAELFNKIGTMHVTVVQTKTSVSNFNQAFFLSFMDGKK